jgi:hypothetical protein
VILGYKLRINGGAYTDEIIDVGNVLTVNLKDELGVLDDNTNYTVEVAAYDGASNQSAWSASQNATTDEVMFSPSDITTSIWIKANDFGLSNDDLISALVDQSGNANNAVQADNAAKAVFKTNILGGKAIARFDGTSDFYQFGSHPQPTAYSWFIVANPNGGSIIGGDTYRRINLLGNGNLEIYDGAGWHYFTAFFTPGGFNRFAFIQTGSQIECYVNNVLKTTFTTSQPEFVVWVGKNVGGDYYNGDIAEMFLCPTDADSSLRNSVDSYFQSEYGL